MSCKALKPLPRGVARATTEHMPFVGHRNCAQWGPNNRHKLGKEMTDKERVRDACEGSAKLRDAIRRTAA